MAHRELSAGPVLTGDAARLARFELDRQRTTSVDELARSFGSTQIGREDLRRSQGPPVRLYPQELPPLNRSQPASYPQPQPYGTAARTTIVFQDDPPPYHVVAMPYEPPSRQYRHSFSGSVTPHPAPLRPAAGPSFATPPRPSTHLGIPLRPPMHITQSDPLPMPVTPPHASSSRPSPPRSPVASPAKAGQCAGTTAKGARCTRIVAEPGRGGTPTRRPAPVDPDGMDEGVMSSLNRMLGRRASRRRPRARPPPRDDDDDTSEDEEAAVPAALDLPRFCHQHAKQAMSEPGAFVGRHGTYIIFREWIPEELPMECKLQLRHEMSAPTTAHDRPGYIYVHEMCPSTRSALSSQTTYLKLGRSVRPVQRLSEWRSQCRSRQPVVRGIFPLADRSATTASSGMAGALNIAPVGAPYHCRLERLILIEASGRASMEAARRSGSAFSQGRTRCVDCGRIHCELFEVSPGAYERWVVSMISRWLMWVETVL